MSVITDVMIDLETLDTRPTAVVLSLGLVAFNRRDPKVPFQELDVKMGTKELREEQTMMGRSIDKETVAWWKQQSPEARRIFKQANVSSVLEGIQKVIAFINSFNTQVLVWGNGASFDNAITVSLFESFGEKSPWPFWNDRCFRTMKGEHGHITRPPAMKGVKHDAVDDARQQALYLQAIYSELQKYNIKSWKDRQV